MIAMDRNRNINNKLNSVGITSNNMNSANSILQKTKSLFLREMGEFVIKKTLNEGELTTILLAFD